MIEEAKEVCRANGGDAKDFADSSKVSGKRGPAQQDYRLIRHACYLVAESADGRKPQVAFAKMYFALTTERYELLATSEEDRLRVEQRQKLLRHHAELALQARAAEVITPTQFAQFFNAGYVGLYHETQAEIHARKGLKPRQDISDYMGSLETAANDFRAALARQMLVDRGVTDRTSANRTHQEAGDTVRSALLSQSIKPEDLPTPTKSYQQLLREEEARARIRAEDASGLWSLLPPGTAAADDEGRESE